MANGLAWRGQIKSQQLGVHPMNRDGLGIDNAHMQSLISGFCSMGWVAETTNGLCVEVKPSDGTVLDFNRRLAEESGVKMPLPDSLGPVRYATLSSSHTNIKKNFLRASVRRIFHSHFIFLQCKWETMRTSIRIFEEAAYTGAMVARALDACEWNAPLGGLGIPTDFGLAVDGISLGFGKVARYDSVIAIIVALVSRVDGILNTLLAAAPTVPLGGHSREQLCQLVLQALRRHPARWNEQVLRARLALIAGDGAMVQGGERSRHSSTNAAKKMFETIFGFASEAWVEWDAFHRADLAYSRAVAQSSSLMEVYDVTACLDNFLSIGDGRALYRSECAMLDETWR